MVELLSITLPVFILIGCGYAALRIGLIKPAHTEGLSAFVVNFALPALIVDALTDTSMASSFDPGYLLGYGVGSLATLGIVFCGVYLMRGRSHSRAAVAALGASASNSGFIGYPLAALAFGDIAKTILPMNMMVENVAILPLTFALAALGDQRGKSALSALSHIAGDILRNPIVIAIIVGGGLAAFQIHLPGPIATSIEMVSTASAPVALFVAGAGLAAMPFKGGAPDAVMIGLLKLVLHPVCVGLALFLVPGITPEMIATGILFAAVPMVSIYPLLARRMGHEELGARALLIAMLAGIVTVSIVVATIQGIAI